MCYFLHAVTRSQYDPDLAETYYNEHNINLSNTTPFVRNGLPEMHYIGIYRGCSCDFLSEDTTRNSREEIHDLIRRFAQTGDVMLSCVYDEGQFEDIGLDLQKAIDQYPKKELSLEEFCSTFPTPNPPNITYIIKKTVDV